MIPLDQKYRPSTPILPSVLPCHTSRVSRSNVNGGFLSIQKNLGALFCIVALVPWLRLYPNHLDSQPWPIIMAIVFIASAMYHIHVPRYTIAIILLLVFGCLVSLFSTLILSPAVIGRAMLGYLSIPVIYVAFYHYLRRFGFPWRIFIAVNVIWILFGLVELAFPQFGEILVGRRTTMDRGVTSLAPEPTFFAIYLFFSSWILLEGKNFQVNRPLIFLLVINLAAVLILAQSTMVFLFYLLACGALFLHLTRSFSALWRHIRWIGVVCVILAFVTIPALQWLDGSRIYRLTEFFYSHPSLSEIVLWDASINQRAEAVVVSFLGALHNGFFPAGFDTFLVTRDSINEIMGRAFWYPTQSIKIMSWMGSIVYELGFIGIIAIVLLMKSAYNGTLHSRVSLIFLMVILLSAIPVAFPLVPMLLALWAEKLTHSPANRTLVK